MDEKQFEAYFRAHVAGAPKPLSGKVQLVPYDPEWPRRFSEYAVRIREALGAQALAVEHAGSTSVPGLLAKPILDVVLVVPDSRSESAYVPAMEGAGFRLHLREPEWHEHRLFKAGADELNLHVFSADCAEVDRMLLFRDWLRTHPEDRELYAQTKLQLAQRPWRYTQEYADAKGEIVREILARAQANRMGAHPSGPPAVA